MDTLSSPRKRDAEATQLRILCCAQKLFSDKGYDAAGIRDIAACADVNVALISRYFGSKKQLFEKAVLSNFDVDAWFDAYPGDWIETVSEQHAKKPAKSGHDPLLAVLRSIDSEDVRDSIRATMDEHLIKPLADRIGGPNKEQKAALLTAQLAGFDLMRRVLGLTSMGSDHEEILHKALTQSLTQITSKS